MVEANNKCKAEYVVGEKWIYAYELDEDGLHVRRMCMFNIEGIYIYIYMCVYVYVFTYIYILYKK